jgi:hypothetical protein
VSSATPFADPYVDHFIQQEMLAYNTVGHDEYAAIFKRKNWIEQTGSGHLPEMVRKIADHLMEKGFNESHAIAVAVNAVKKMCRGRLNWQPKGPPPGSAARARACKSFAEWEAKKAEAKARRG